MLNRIISSLVRKAIFGGIALAVLLAIGFFTADRKDYPGKKQFEQANDLIDSKSKGTAQGDSEATRAAAVEFSASMKQLQAALFSGGSGKTFATGGEFLTYVKRTPSAVVVLCHVPELRNYKNKEAREALSKIAWIAAQKAAAKIPNVKPGDTLIVGLRGFASYGPIWEGPLSGEANIKSDGVNEQKRLYPFFVEKA